MEHWFHEKLEHHLHDRLRNSVATEFVAGTVGDPGEEAVHDLAPRRLLLCISGPAWTADKGDT